VVKPVRHVFAWSMLTIFWAFWCVPVLAMETRLLLGPLPDTVEATGLPGGWQPLNFHDIESQTEYTVVKDGYGYALKAVSEGSASGIFTEMDLDAHKYSHLAWEWKIGNLIEKGDATRQSGDDFPARIIIAFSYQPDRASLFKRMKYEVIRLIYGRYPPGGALVYVWDNKLPVGTTLDNAYTSWAKMIVLESGPSKVGEWVTEQRNFYEDYQRAFGENPTRLKFIGLMTDTDDTGERAVAYFRQFALESR